MHKTNFLNQSFVDHYMNLCDTYTDELILSSI